MSRLVIFSGLLVLVVIIGCSSAPDSVETDTQRAASVESDGESSKAWEKQGNCPVSGAELGSMGEPKKIDVSGQDVWICCSACEDKLLADPEVYLAKLSNNQ